jgi:PAS domain-containing protein
MNDDRTSYLRALLNAIPATIFVMDDDLKIRDFNDAAENAFGFYPSTALNRRGGEVLHCLHATDVPEGCGRGPHCKDCVIRNSVTDSLTGHRVTRRRTSVTLVLGADHKELDLLVTASPLPQAAEPLSLLILEDISDMRSVMGDE